MRPRDSASWPSTASRPPLSTGRGSKMSRWGELACILWASSCWPFVLLMLPSDGPEQQHSLSASQRDPCHLILGTWVCSRCFLYFAYCPWTTCITMCHLQRTCAVLQSSARPNCHAKAVVLKIPPGSIVCVWAFLCFKLIELV